MSKLIIIRGPSGAGKSTVAKALMDRVTKTTALIDRDYYMFMFRPDDGSAVPDKELLENNILMCLDRGIDVIFEGNFRVDTHQQLLDRILAVHPDDNHMFYLDVSLPETLRRHDARSEKMITKERMKELYRYATPLYHPLEVRISENSSLEETIDLIKNTAQI